MITITASNRNRFDLNSNLTKLFLEGFRRQTVKDFQVIIVDGGSDNLDQILDYCAKETAFKISVVKHPIGDKFQRALLNNVGVRNAKTPYALTTDVDIFFAKDFVEYIGSIFKERPNVFLESRTLYWKPPLAQMIYDGKLNPWDDLSKCQVGRIKNRTTAGGCQCAHMSVWEKVRGFDENFIGWGSGDYDLLNRISRAGINTVWIGEIREEIRVFHQPHPKPNLVEDLKDQEANKNRLNSVKPYAANPEGWGGIKDG